MLTCLEILGTVGRCYRSLPDS